MQAHRIFDHRRINIVPAPNDQIFRPSSNKNTALFIGISQITAVEYTVIKHAGVLLWVEITARHRRAGHGPHADFMGLALGTQAAIGLQATDRHAGVRQRIADRAGSTLAAGKINRDQTRRFGHTQNLVQPFTGHGFKALTHCARQ